MHLVSLNRFCVHLQVPHFDRQVVPGQHVAAIVTELDVGDAADDLWEETSVGGVFRLLKYCGHKLFY